MATHSSPQSKLLICAVLWHLCGSWLLAACAGDDADLDAPLPSVRSGTSPAISDDFDRADSLIVGQTAQGYSWVEAGGADQHARVIGNELSLHYFDPVSIGAVYTNVEDYQAARIDASARMKGHNAFYMSDGRFFGLSWRMPGEAGTWDSAGYHLRVDASGLSVHAGPSAVAGCQAAVEIDTDWHEYRVVSIGRSHRIFMDGAEVIDCIDDTYSAAGHVGLYAYYSIVRADDFSVTEIEPPARTYPQFSEYAAADDVSRVAVADHFHLRNGDVLGASGGGITWIEEGDGDAHVSIVDDHYLRFHYFTSGAARPHSWAVADGLALRDVEVRGRARGLSEHYMTDRPFGFSYRLQGTAVDHDDPGYHVLVTASGVRLMAGSTEVASWVNPVDDAWHDYRVEAEGDRHRVFMDGTPIIDVLDATYPDAGRVGLAGYYSISYFDHVLVRSLPAVEVGRPVTDDFERADADVLGAFGGITWDEEGGGDEHVSVGDGALRVHYFAGDTPANPHSWAVATGLELRNVELRGRARGHDEFYMTDRPFGFSYRLPGAAADHDDPGYHVLVSASGVELTAGAVAIASWAHPMDTAWHDYRAVAVGNHHRVFLDDALIIDVVDDTYPDAGRVGVAGYYSISYFDHVSARALPASGTDPRGLDMMLGYWSVEPQDVDDVRPHGVNTVHAFLSALEQATAPTAAAAIEDYVARMAAEGMGTLSWLGSHFIAAALEKGLPSPTPSDESEVAAAIDALDGYGNTNFWYLPEELRYWSSDERQEGLNLRAWAQQYDPERRPVLMYSPNHGTSGRLKEELEWTDVLLGGALCRHRPGPVAGVGPLAGSGDAGRHPR